MTGADRAEVLNCTYQGLHLNMTVRTDDHYSMTQNAPKVWSYGMIHTRRASDLTTIEILLFDSGLVTDRC